MLSNIFTTLASVNNIAVKDTHQQGLNSLVHRKSWLLLYFSTSWCAPCKTMKPHINKISVKYAEQLEVVKIDVDEQIKLAKQLAVTGVPTLVLLDKYGATSHLVGGVNTDEISRWLNKQINQPDSSPKTMK